MPGQLDFDIGRIVSNSVGVKHHALDLRLIKFTWDSICDSVSKSPWTYVPDGFFNTISRNKYATSEDTVWSGFLGDPLTGSHLFDFSYDTEKTISHFSNKQKRLKENICEPGFSYEYNISKLTNNHLELDNYDALDFGIRQANCIAPIVMPMSKWKDWSMNICNENNGTKCIAPFADMEWAGYWLAAPKEARKGQRSYLGALKYKFPDLFSIPSKHSMGINHDDKVRYLIRNWIHSTRNQIYKRAPWMKIQSNLMLNYLDYDEMFRSREDYKICLLTAFNYLTDNQIVPWLNLNLMFEDHINRKKNYGDTFVVLIGLAANIIVNELPNY